MSNAHPLRVLRVKRLWTVNGVIVGFVALLFTVFYVGANIDPSPSRSRSRPRAETGSIGS